MSAVVSIPSQARPYAVAVFALAREKGETRQWSEALRAVAEAAEAVFAEIAGRALVPQGRLAEAVLELADSGLRSDESRNFVRVLAENRRLDLAGAVAELFEGFRREDEGVERATVETAMPLDAGARDSLKAALEARTGKKIQAEYRDNPDLLAGVRVRIRDDVWDASARGRLERLTTAMGR